MMEYTLECYTRRIRRNKILSGFSRKDTCKFIIGTIKCSCTAHPLITPPWPQHTLLRIFRESHAYNITIRLVLK